MTSLWIFIFAKRYSWENWTSTAICYLVVLAILPVAVFVKHKLVFKISGIFLIFLAALFAGFELYSCLKRKEGFHQRLIHEYTIEELHKIENKYKCCGVYGPDEYAVYPESCCGIINGITLCPYVHGCEKPFYYWESLKETWRVIGDALKFFCIVLLSFFCFSQSIPNKEYIENEVDTTEGIVDDEDLWVMEEKEEPKPNEIEERRNSKLSFSDYETCYCDLKDDDKGSQQCCFSDIQDDNKECQQCNFGKLEEKDEGQREQASLIQNEEGTNNRKTINENIDDNESLQSAPFISEENTNVIKDDDIITKDDHQ